LRVESDVGKGRRHDDCFLVSIRFLESLTLATWHATGTLSNVVALPDMDLLSALPYCHALHRWWSLMEVVQ
jgi:hypothetical protein